MSKKINILSNLPKNVQDTATEVTDLNKIKALLEERSIVAADRYILEPGTYKYKSVIAAEWPVGKGKNAKQALMCAIEFDGDKITTIGNLLKTDASRKSYGPKNLPLNQADLLDEIIAKGIKVTAVEEVRFTDFRDGERTVDENDPSGYRTKPGKVMVWQFAK